MFPKIKLATLESAEVQKIEALEAELGSQVMAFESGSPYARLSEEKLAKVQGLEEDLGVILVVYEE